MFRFMRKSAKVKKYLLIFFLGIVSLGMVITLMPLNPSDAERGDTSSLAQIGGHKITAQELDNAIRNRMKNSQYGYDPSVASMMAQPILDDMIQHESILVQAKKLGITASPAEVQKAAQAIPGLAESGALASEEKFEQATGMTMSQFETQIADSITYEKMQDIVSDGVQVTPDDVRAEFVKRNTKAKIQYVLFDPNQFVKSVKVTPDALEAFFKKNGTRYSLPEERRVRYVLIDTDHLRDQAKVTDDDVKSYYETHLSDYRLQDRAHVLHILFKTTGKTPEEVSAAEKTANAVLGQIKAGKDFSELAKQYSEDTTSAQKGGDLGWIVHGQTVKEFDDVAFTMKPGQVSGLVKTIYGIHIVKVLERQMAHVESLEEVKGDIRKMLEEQKLDQAQQTASTDLGHRFKEDPKKFADVAREAGLEVKESPLFKFKETVPDFGNSEAFANLAFQLRLNEVGDPITVPKGLAIIQVEAIVPEHAAKLDEVRAQVEVDYRTEQSKVLAANGAQELFEKSKTQDFKAAARALKLAVKESKDFTQQDTVENVGPATSLPAAFTLPVGQASVAVLVAGNKVVFSVLSRTPPNDADFANQKDQVTEELLERKRSLAFEIYKSNLKLQLIRSGELKINQAAMKQFRAANAPPS
ncbi:MAG TPA: peptidyl-prolyl cis-trans isomerase [Terriglobia bacterium]|nr:peptidyl-prolyl cis-trans isomerase [Terriglobia bacterium]